VTDADRIYYDIQQMTSAATRALEIAVDALLEISNEDAIREVFTEADIATKALRDVAAILEERAVDPEPS